MNSRFIESRVACENLVDVVMSLLTREGCERPLHVLRASMRTLLKTLDELIEEADTDAKLLAAVAAIALADDGTAAADQVLLHVSPIEAIIPSQFEFHRRWRFAPMCIVASSLPSSYCVTWSDLPDAALSVVSGPGTRCISRGAAALKRNQITVTPRTQSGMLPEYVKASDIQLALMDSLGAAIDVNFTVDVPVPVDGAFELRYCVNASAPSVFTLHVRVCGVLIDTQPAVHVSYDACTGDHLVATHELHLGRSYLCSAECMAVNTSRTSLAITKPNMHSFEVYQLQPSFKWVRTITRYGSANGEFVDLGGICFLDDDHLLMCDTGNNRVQLLTLAGSYVRKFSVSKPVVVAVHGEHMAVCSLRFVELYVLTTGAFVWRSGPGGDIVGNVNAFYTCATFSPDGNRIIIFDAYQKRMSMFSIDGSFIKHSTAAISMSRRTCIQCTTSSMIVASDLENQCIYVFDADATVLVNTIKIPSDNNRRVDATAIAISGPRLYVLLTTGTGSVVQVFE